MAASLGFPIKPFKIMGILNVTPDSFSDGGRFVDAKSACEHAYQLLDDGADIIDLGAESTRPGAEAVRQEDEWARLEPVLAFLNSGTRPLPKLSIDTRKPGIMLRAVEMGVTLVNDVSGSADMNTLSALASRSEVSYLANHCHLQPESMQQSPLSAKDALSRVKSFFAEQSEKLQQCGFSRNRIWLDPGIGFGKTDLANLALWAQSASLSKSYQVAVGVSRKSLLGRLCNIEEPSQRDAVSKIAELSLVLNGVQMIRTHDVVGLTRMRDVLTRID